MQIIDCIVKINYEYEQDKIKQIFQVDLKKSLLKKIFDKRFEAYELFEKKLKRYSLKKFLFIDRVDENNLITLVYNNVDQCKYESQYFKLYCAVPQPTCEFCLYFEKNGLYHCLFKNKDFSQPVKYCSFFKQKKGVIKT